MPANIDSMMYTGQRPWHGLGTKLEDAPTSEEAIEAAGLDWKAMKVPLVARHSGGETVVSDRFAIMRDDRLRGSDAVVLGIVGTQYEPIQNRDAFRFFDPIIEDGTVQYETAGSLGNGERVWILAKLRDPIQVTKTDRVDKYLLLSNSHDGSRAAQVQFTPIRVVCQNTLSIAVQGKALAKIAHLRDANAKLEDVQDAVRFITDTYNNIAERFQKFATFKMLPGAVEKYVGGVLPTSMSSDPTVDKKLARWRRAIASLFENGRGNGEPGVKGTLWAAYNAVTEFADYRMTAGMRSQSARVNGLWFGDAARLKMKAYEAAVKLVGTASN